MEIQEVKKRRVYKPRIRPKYLSVCRDCGGERWLTYRSPSSRSEICMKCAYKYMTHLHRHGGAARGGKSRLYSIWTGMKRRCGPLSKGETRANYYARGIRVCADWQTFVPFRDWAIRAGYSDELQIDRINNDGNYEPSNCRWVTHAVNGQNSRRAKLTMFKARLARAMKEDGLSCREIGKQFGVERKTIEQIVRGAAWVDTAAKIVPCDG